MIDTREQRPFTFERYDVETVWILWLDDDEMLENVEQLTKYLETQMVTISGTIVDFEEKSIKKGAAK